MFSSKLLKVDPTAISEDKYCKAYLQHLMQHHAYYLKIYAGLLDNVLKNSSKPKAEAQLIDFGCGNGLLGLFAAFCGVKDVVLVDSEATFVQAAKKLANALNLKATFIVGSYSDLTTLKPDVLIAVDVIEHVYDPADFLSVIRSLNPNVSMGFVTVSNPWNKKIMKRLMQLQWQDEHVGNVTGGLMGDKHPPYKEMRRAIIEKSSVGNNENLLNATRGLYGKYLDEAIRNFSATGFLPTPPHGNNTCNPVTGSWTERLFTPQEYQNLFFCDGYRYEIQPGFYNSTGLSVKSLIKGTFNMIIGIFGNKIAPWIQIFHFKS